MTNLGTPGALLMVPKGTDIRKIIPVPKSTDPRDAVMEKIGSLDGITLYNAQVLVAIYERPKVTAKGIHLADQTLAEDEYQGKAALVLKMGPMAYKDPDGRWFTNADISPGDWIVVRPSDTWNININGVKCRMLNDTATRMKIDDPIRVW
jgi:co-chaperonin GroES (HSP10)